MWSDPRADPSAPRRCSFGEQAPKIWTLIWTPILASIWASVRASLTDRNVKVAATWLRRSKSPQDVGRQPGNGPQPGGHLWFLASFPDRRSRPAPTHQPVRMGPIWVRNRLAASTQICEGPALPRPRAAARVNQILTDSIKCRPEPPAPVDNGGVRFAVVRHLYGNLPVFSAHLYHLFIGAGRDGRQPS